MPVAAILIIAILAALFILAKIFIHYVEYHGIGPQDGVWRGGRNAPMKVAITFDDGPSRDFTPKILDILAEKNAKATFFMTGALVEEFPEIAARVAAEGHDFGNHTYHHVNMIFLKGEAIDKEINLAESAIQKAIGRKPALFRPPRSLFSDEVRRKLLDRGYKIVMWTASAADWLPGARRFVVSRIRRGLKPGAVFLFHDGGAMVANKGGRREDTVYALPLVIDMIRESGYELVTIGELISETS
jgi:peptidoglycan/xylan/chitin deacetylase (PgdA/CDA1 family)